MRHGTLLLLVVLAIAVVVRMRTPLSRGNGALRSDNSFSIERTPVCPWREPQRDLLALFPPATNYTLETRILSGRMAPIQKRLGRGMTVDENPLRIFRVQHPGETGSVLVTRVKGEHGAIEIVTGVSPRGDVRGVLIQSQREPQAVARVITNAAFLGSFAAKDSSSALVIGEDLPVVPELARVSAQAIADGVRSQLIVLSFAEQSLEARELGIHTNH